MVFDPSVVSFDALLSVFWSRHDPTTLNRQGGDAGTQYRSGIYAADEAQLAAAVASRDAAAAGAFAGRTIVSDVELLRTYTDAEEYHQYYLERGGRAGQAQDPRKTCTDPVRCYG